MGLRHGAHTYSRDWCCVNEPECHRCGMTPEWRRWRNEESRYFVQFASSVTYCRSCGGLLRYETSLYPHWPAELLEWPGMTPPTVTSPQEGE